MYIYICRVTDVIRSVDHVCRISISEMIYIYSNDWLTDWQWWDSGRGTIAIEHDTLELATFVHSTGCPLYHLWYQLPSRIVVHVWRCMHDIYIYIYIKYKHILGTREIFWDSTPLSFTQRLGFAPWTLARFTSGKVQMILCVSRPARFQLSELAVSTVLQCTQRINILLEPKFTDYSGYM